MRRSARGERLDALRVEDEAHHHGDTAEEEDALEDVHAVLADAEQVAERPAGREGGAEHLGADQDRGADDGQHVEPVDAAARGLLYGGVHRSFLRQLLGFEPSRRGAMSSIWAAGSRPTSGPLSALTLRSPSAAR